MTTSVQSATRGPAESARYALLRRLAPSIRHHLVVNLQPIGMIYEVIDRRLRQPEPDLAEVFASAHKINGFARAALDSCLDVVTWLAPEEDARITASEGVRECLGLLATSLTFRGFILRNEVVEIGHEVPRAAMRNVLTGALIHVTDQDPLPGELVISAGQDQGCVVLTLTLRPGDDSRGFTAESAYRKLEWADVEALAAAESVGVVRESPERVRLSLPLARPR